jgi:hypothetical protein
MANEEHLRILKEGVAVWNEWQQETRIFRPDLSNANLRRADLSRANLRRADLSDANLVFANLSRANLSDAILIRANLSGANLSGADLNDASLFAADLSDAYLRDADLRGALLKYANLTSAHLDNTSFSNSRLYHTNFAFTSLKTARGLEACKHEGPSSLDYHTLMNSGRLPDVFLRGCGLSDEFIQHLESLWIKPIQFYSCFISYSTKDDDFAQRLYADLQARGIRCWFVKGSVLGNWYSFILFTLCSSPRSPVSFWLV